MMWQIKKMRVIEFYGETLEMIKNLFEIGGVGIVDIRSESL
jgi:serine kinase of HPr protein (carbohydrate metabolism regulator)